MKRAVITGYEIHSQAKLLRGILELVGGKSFLCQNIARKKCKAAGECVLKKPLKGCRKVRVTITVENVE